MLAEGLWTTWTEVTIPYAADEMQTQLRCVLLSQDSFMFQQLPLG